jgi:dATP pyrophosphohydrolase
MPRAPFQVLIIPYFRTSKGMIEYAVFNRSDAGYGQFLSGGGENDETPMVAAIREAHEEAGISPKSIFFKLDSIATVPTNVFKGHESWGKEVYVIPEHCFAVEVFSKNIRLSAEHDEYKWGDFQTASGLLKWDSNRNALWELNQRLSNVAN